MLTKEILQSKLADLEKTYVDFCLKQFGSWKDFALATRRIYKGEAVDEADVPASYLHEFRMLREVLKMEATGKFDWTNPVLKESFSHFVTSDYYKIWGATITEISLRIAQLAGVKTLVEIGAGKGNLTEIMITRLDKAGMTIPLIVTDVSPAVLENIGKLKNRFQHLPVATMAWDIKEQPPAEFVQMIQHPCLMYERASIMYSNIASIENMAAIADIVVFGDMFNYTGELDAYDDIAKKIGGEPLFYSGIRLLMEKCFQDHFMFDLRAQEALGYPSTTILIGWR
jgi:hypothetical protein